MLPSGVIQRSTNSRINMRKLNVRWYGDIALQDLLRSIWTKAAVIKHCAYAAMLGRGEFEKQMLDVTARNRWKVFRTTE